MTWFRHQAEVVWFEDAEDALRGRAGVARRAARPGSGRLTP